MHFRSTRSSHRAQLTRRPTRLTLEILEDRTLLAVAAPSAFATLDAESLTANERFVARLSSTLVSEPLSEQTQARLVRWLELGVARENVAAWILRTEGARKAEITNTFNKLLQRNPTPHELKQQLTALGRRHDQLVVIWNVVRSNEYFQTRGGGTTTGFLNALAEDLLRRDATADELATWSNDLERGMTRTRFTARFLKSETYRSVAADQIAFHGTRNVDSQELTDEVLAAMVGRQPLTRAKARAYGSDQYLDWLLTPPQRPPVLPVGNPIVPPNPGYPFTPSFSLVTNWNPISPENVTLFNINGISAGPDGVYWLGTNEAGAYVYDPVAETTTSIWSGAAISIATISATEAWIIGYEQYQVTPLEIGTLTTSGQFTAVANLPGGDTPTQISTAAGAPVWVLGQSGAIYAYSEQTDSWTTVASNGFTFKEISIGGANNIYAVGANEGTPAMLTWNGTEWSVDSDFKGITPTHVAAGTDGSVWAIADNLMFLRPPGDEWQEATSNLPGEVFEFVAYDRNRALALMEVESFLQVFSLGVIDRPATPFPEITDQWQLGYDAITAAFKIVNPNGIRGLYNDATAPLQNWYDDLTNGNVPMPLGITSENWGAITNQIAMEVSNVQGVNSLFSALDKLNTNTGIANGNSLSTAKGLVELTTEQENNDTVELFIVGMFEAAMAGMASALSGGAAVAASIIGSGIGSLISDLTNQPSPTPDTKLEQTYVELEETLGNLFLNNLTAYGTAQNKIVQDYGMLLAVGGAVNSGLWFWEDTTGSTLANATADAFALFFYQALMPIKWEIVYDHDFICDLYTCPTFKAPDYASYTVQISKGTYKVLEDVYYVSQVGSSTDPFSTTGPFPTQMLMSELFSTLGVSKSDFFTGQSGWNLNVVDAT